MWTQKPLKTRFILQVFPKIFLASTSREIKNQYSTTLPYISYILRTIHKVGMRKYLTMHITHNSFSAIATERLVITAEADLFMIFSERKWNCILELRGTARVCRVVITKNKDDRMESIYTMQLAANKHPAKACKHRKNSFGKENTTTRKWFSPEEK